MNKISLAIAIVFGGYSTLFSQKYTLEWKGHQTIDYGTEKRNYPKFSNDGYSVENASIYYNIKGESNGKMMKIQNQQWKKISANQLLDLQDDAIPENDLSGINYINDPTNGQENYYAKISVFRKENNDIYQLQSFEIVEDKSPKKLRKSAAIISGPDENPLKSGNIYKIKVDKSGIFKIDRKFLSDNGINPNNINPKHLKIYGNGGIMLSENNHDNRYSAPQEVAIQVVGEEDGIWNDGDYALFYAQGADGYNLFGNFGNNIRQRDYRTDSPTHLKNIYEDHAYYFLTFDNGEGKRVQDESTPITGTILTRYNDYQYINNDKTNLLKLGRVWVDDAINTEKTISFTLKTPLNPDDEVVYRTSVVGYNNANNAYKVNINGENETQSTFRNTTFDKRVLNENTSGLSGNTLNINIKPINTANPSGTLYLDYVEVMYPQDLKFNGSQMNFRSYEIEESTGDNYGFSISESSPLEQVWEVSDIINPKRKINQSGNNSQFSFGYNADKTDFNNEFVAFRNSSAYTPQFVGRIENQDLHAIQNVDYLIITRKDMILQGERIAEYYKNKKNYNVQVVDIAQVYNEFSSGSQDITAIRDFISRLKYERGGLKYVLLIGDTSYDFKDRISGNDNIIPSYQSEQSGDYAASFVSDDYFVMTKTQTSPFFINNAPDIPIGRLPASNISEAKLLVDKTLAYYNALPNQSSPFGDWRLKLNFVSDDMSDSSKDTGLPYDNMVDSVITSNFQDSPFKIKKLYIDSFVPENASGGTRYPQVNKAITDDMSNSLYMFYFGHGGINGWGQERILTLDDIQSFNNYSSIHSRFPLVSTITCEFTLWDDPSIASAGEQVMKHKTGGAATMITSSRAIGISYGREITQILTEDIFNNNIETLGDAFLSAKLKKIAQDRRVDSNHFRVNYLGDPAMALSIPKPLITFDSVETPISGKLRALDKVKITGKVTTTEGGSEVNENFNGKISISIFGKPTKKQTRNNARNNSISPATMEFSEEGAPIVKASGKVEKGIFSVEFYMPKDINFEDEQGRILAYADNFETAKANAFDVYHNEPNIIIGGINPNPDKDNAPPAVKLYMNNTNFADGGITNANPTLLACITDDIGINASGTGIGHDITIVLDGEVVNTIVANDFFSAGEGNGCINPSLLDYQKGSLAYPFRNLKAGQHQITFKVWDINNNSATASLNFVVKDEADSKLTLNRLLNWPNPFTDKTYIQFEHNCDDILDVNVQIYTITGKLVKTISTPVSAETFREGYRTPRTAIEWDGKDDFGNAVGKGTYIYKVFAKSKNQDRCKGSAQAIEKLVILK